MTSSTRRAAALPPALKRGGNGTPHRLPSRPSRTTSTPRTRTELSKLRRCGRYPMWCWARAGVVAAISSAPAESGTSPSTARSKVDLPTPFGPSTASEFAGADVECDAAPDGPARELHGGVAERQERAPGRRLTRVVVGAADRRIRLVELRPVEVHGSGDPDRVLMTRSLSPARLATPRVAWTATPGTSGPPERASR